MTPKEFKKLRESFGYKPGAWGKLLGYSRAQIWRFETGVTPIAENLSEIIIPFKIKGLKKISTNK